MKRKMISVQTVQRLPLYLEKVREAIAAGEEYISSAMLAKELNLDPVLMRKDLAMTGAIGVPRLGFQSIALRDAITSCLGWENANEAIICGVGSLGQALLGYGGFRNHNLSIVLAFDTNPSLIGKKKHGVPVHSLDQMDALVRRLRVKIGILCVPAFAAQECADRMIASGIIGIWNFTPHKLTVPENVTVQRVDLAASLALLSHEIAHRSRRESIRQGE